VAGAAHAENRIALVFGNGAYQAGPINTAANDASAIAQTLQAAGFDVVGARDPDPDKLWRSVRGVLDEATAAGPDTIAFIYFSGYGLQLEGENDLIPNDARIRDSGVVAEAVRMPDDMRPLAALHLKAGTVVLDAARQDPCARSGPPLAGGLTDQCLPDSIRMFWSGPARPRRAARKRAVAHAPLMPRYLLLRTRALPPSTSGQFRNWSIPMRDAHIWGTGGFHL
jgi:uncharacterized caspase-like protein